MERNLVILTMAVQSKIWLKMFAGLFAAWGSGAAGFSEPFPGEVIVYNQYEWVDGVPIAHLRGGQPDGRGDHRIEIDLPEPGYPVWSPDGRLLSVTSLDPYGLNPVRREVFVLDSASGLFGRVTGLPLPSFAVSFPFYKAFSPAGTRVAATFYVIVGGGASQQDSDGDGKTNDFDDDDDGDGILDPTDPDDDNDGILDGDDPDHPLNQGGGGNPGTLPGVGRSVRQVMLPTGAHAASTGTLVIPVLQIYSLSGQLPATVYLAGPNEGLNHGGDGIDWHPQRDKLIYPVKILTPFGNSPIASYVTALYVLDPVSDAATAGETRQLTFPRGEVAPPLQQPYTFWQDDIQPAVSPEGTQVAYIRLDAVLNAFGGPFHTPSLRVVNFDGSNDRELLRFDEGDYLGHVDWSPSGQQLVFDVGREATGSTGAPLNTYDPMSMELYIVNADGTELRQLHGAGSAFPAWRPSLQPELDPLILGMTPRLVEAGEEDVRLLVTGIEFSAALELHLNGAELATTFVSPNRLEADLPSEAIAQPGLAMVTLWNPATETSVGEPSTLYIQYPATPVIVRHPEDHRASPGGTVEFRVEAVGGAGSLSFQWFHNGNPLDGADSADLVINNITPREAGEYHVLVGDAQTQVASRVATLTVTDTSTTNVRLHAALRSDGFLQLEITGGEVNDIVTIQASSNLETWIPIAKMVWNGDALSFVDPESPAHSRRYYRILGTRADGP